MSSFVSQYRRLNNDIVSMTDQSERTSMNDCSLVEELCVWRSRGQSHNRCHGVSVYRITGKSQRQRRFSRKMFCEYLCGYALWSGLGVEDLRRDRNVTVPTSLQLIY